MQAGSLELAWEDGRGHRVEVEFLPDRFQYFVESEAGDQEGEVELCVDTLVLHRHEQLTTSDVAPRQHS